MVAALVVLLFSPLRDLILFCLFDLLLVLLDVVVVVQASSTGETKSSSPSTSAAATAAANSMQVSDDVNKLNEKKTITPLNALLKKPPVSFCFVLFFLSSLDHRL